jgi:hypothetical protein
VFSFAKLKGIYAGISPFGKAISALRFGLGTAHILQVCCAFLTSQALKSLLPNGEISPTMAKYPIGKSLVNGFCSHLAMASPSL